MRTRWIGFSLAVGLLCAIAVWLTLGRRAQLSPAARPHEAAPVAVPTPRPAIAFDFEIDPATKCTRGQAVLRIPPGSVRICFYAKEAPQTVARVVELIQSGFYNGLTFHRVVPGILVQTGDPEGNGFGGSGKKLPAEFNRRPHNEGVLGMARARDLNSADSQFYITLSPQPALDRDYTVFGEVVSGLDALKQLAVGDRIIEFYVENPPAPSSAASPGPR